MRESWRRMEIIPETRKGPCKGLRGRTEKVQGEERNRRLSGVSKDEGAGGEGAGGSRVVQGHALRGLGVI